MDEMLNKLKDPDFLQFVWKSDKVLSCNNSLLFHIRNNIFHQILLAKSMKHIITGNYVSSQYIRLLQQMIYLPCIHLQCIGYTTNTENSFIEKNISLSILIHILIITFVCTASDIIHPLLIIKIPLHRLLNTFFKLKARLPAQFILQLCRVNGIA